MATLDRRAVACIAALVAIVPLVTDPSGWYVYVNLRWAFLVSAVAAAVIGLAVTGHLRSPAAARWWAAMVVVAVTSAVLSSSWWVAIFGTVDRRGGAAMWIVHGGCAVIGASVVTGRSHLRWILRGLSVGSVGVAAVVGAQRLGWTFPSGAVSRVRPGGPLGNADFLGAYAAVVLLASTGAAFDDEERDGWHLVHVVAALAASFCLVLSGTRGAWLGVVAGLVVFAVLAARRSGLPLRQALAGAVLAIVGLGALAVWAGVGHRMGTVASGTAAGRVATWERTATVVGERPVLGWGPEGFAEGFGRAVDDGWERAYGRRLTPDRAHNGLLDVGAGMGLVGLVAYVGLLTSTARSVHRSLTGSATGASMTMIGVAAALVAYVVQQQFLFQLFDVDAVVWVLAGALAGLSRLDVTTDDRAPVPATAPAPRVASRIPARAVALPAVCVLGLCSFVAARGVVADRDLRRSADLAASTPGDAVVAAGRALDAEPQTLAALALADAALADGTTGTLESVRERLGVVRGVTFDDGRLTLARSRLSRSLGVIDAMVESEAEVGALLADDRSRGDAWLELGEIRLRLGADAAAQRAFERSVALRPANVDAWVGLATAAERSGDLESAGAAIAHVDPSDLGGDALVLRGRLLAETSASVVGR